MKPDEKLAPIVLFVYNRPQHTHETLEALKNNELAERSRLVVYCDGPKGDDDRAEVEPVRAEVDAVTGFADVEVVKRDSNVGLAANIIDGVTSVLNRYGRVIVLEDDLVTAPYFLRFMNDALECYADEPRVGHIQAYDFTGDPALPETFLIKWTGSWGWATWDRAWRLFNPDGKALLDELRRRRLTRTFDLNGNYRFTRMLRHQVEGKNNSWAIRWNASLFLADVLSLNVGRSLVQNIGFDGSGTHCGSEALYTAKVWTDPLPVQPIFPVEENLYARQSLGRYYHRTAGFWAKVRRRLKSLLRKR